MKYQDIMREYGRRAVLLTAAIRHGMGEGDNRVGFTILVHFGPDRRQTLVDVAAIPPCAVDLYRQWMSRDGNPLMALDRHAGQWDGKPSGKPSPIDDMFLSDTPMPALCVPLLLHARRLYYGAATRGRKWTGTLADLPPVMHPEPGDDDE